MREEGGDVTRERRIGDISFRGGGASIPLPNYGTNILICQERQKMACCGEVWRSGGVVSEGCSIRSCVSNGNRLDKRYILSLICRISCVYGITSAEVCPYMLALIPGPAALNSGFVRDGVYDVQKEV